jgi:hypothetical protein
MGDDPGIAAHKRHTLDGGLGDQEAIKGVALLLA